MEENKCKCNFNHKEKETNLSEIDKIMLNSDYQNSSTMFIILLFLLFSPFGFKDTRKCRSDLMKEIQDSDLGNTEKKQILDILSK